MNEDIYVSPDVPKMYTISYMHYSTIGTIIGISVGLIVSILFPTEQNIDPKLLTPFVRKMYLKHTDKLIDEKKTEDYISDCWDSKL